MQSDNVLMEEMFKSCILIQTMVVDHEIPRRDEKKTYSSYVFGSENNFPFEIFMTVFMKMHLNDLI